MTQCFGANNDTTIHIFTMDNEGEYTKAAVVYSATVPRKGDLFELYGEDYYVSRTKWVVPKGGLAHHRKIIQAKVYLESARAPF